MITEDNVKDHESYLKQIHILNEQLKAITSKDNTLEKIVQLSRQFEEQATKNQYQTVFIVQLTRIGA